MNADQHGQGREDQVVLFREWNEVLQAEAMAPALKALYRQEIVAFLHFCKIHHAGASVILVKQYLAVAETQGRIQAREALRWWFRAAKTGRRSLQLKSGVEVEGQRASGGRAEPLRGPATAGGANEAERLRRPATGGTNLARTQDLTLPQSREQRRSSTPPRAAEDLGGADWERDLIKACRVRGFLWRTEQTYREWGVKFAAFLHPRTPYLATKEDLGAFLSKLAVTQRASPSTQKQALNAIVFLIQEALHHELGEFDFQRAWPTVRMPVVLSANECLNLFPLFVGTTRVMAELMYGSGVRLMELLRLRVQDPDIDRGCLMVRAGKGDKDRVTVLPASLNDVLRRHMDRLRGLFAEDRALGIPGVWLPEGLDRKYPNAGVSWEWQWLFPSREASIDPVSGILRRHHVQAGAFQTAVRRAARAAGINKRVTPHVFRHSFGTHMIEGGADIRTVQELMGHADIRTTQIYVHVMQKGLGSVSPLDRLGINPLDKLKGSIPPAKPGLINPNWPLPPGGSGAAAGAAS